MKFNKSGNLIVQQVLPAPPGTYYISIMSIIACERNKNQKEMLVQLFNKAHLGELT